MARVFDTTAEQMVAAVSALSSPGARLARSRLDEADFHDRRCWRVVLAGAEVAGLVLDERYDAVADLASQPRPLVRSWVAACPVMYDEAGVWAERVRDGAAARGRALALAEEVAELGGAVSWEAA